MIMAEGKGCNLSTFYVHYLYINVTDLPLYQCKIYGTRFKYQVY